MPTKGNDISIYINMNDAEYSFFTGAATENVVTDYTWTDGDADGQRDSGEGNWVLVACATSATINLSNSTVEAACKEDTGGNLTGDSIRYVVGGNQTWNMSVDGLVNLVDFDVLDSTDVDITETDPYSGETVSFAQRKAGFVNLMRAAISRDEFLVAFTTGDNGRTEYAGKAFISQIDATAAVGDFATYSATFEGNGQLYKRTTDTTV